MNDMPKAYEPQGREDALYKLWVDSGFFNPDTPSPRFRGISNPETFSIMMPPPNVTGVLHLGHALENALMDAMARYQRLRGKKVLLVPGTDHAALPTQAKVEKLLMAKGMKNPRQELGREGLLAEIRAFAEESRSTILSQVKKMGTSCDWSRLAYTFDEERNVAVNELFKRMYNDGLIYRGYRVVNWSVKGQSTSSDDEIVYVERPSKLYTFKYSKDFPFTIATTRPETKLGDTAVAVHPDDERYAKYIGQEFVVDVGAAEPLKLKIIADEGVDPKFGTGALGVTPAHSPVDFAMYEKQKAKGDPIGIVPVIGIDGRMTAAAGKQYEGMKAEEAREVFVQWLTENGLLTKEPEEIVQNVGTSDRYGDVIESLPLTQWWLSMNTVIPGRGKTLKDLMREAVTTGLDNDDTQKVAITPDRFTKLYLDRVESLRDWCLSRQTWWGHRIPVWYRSKNDDPAAREVHVGAVAPKGEGWVQDEDTLDTWFSSGSWTFSTLGWPTTRVIFARHGEAEFNVADRIDAKGDPANRLTDKGKKQVLESVKALSKEKVSAVYASPLARTMETAALYGEAFGVPVEIDERLKEVQGADGQGVKEYVENRYENGNWRDRADLGYENFDDLKKRMEACVKDIVKRHPGQTVVIVSHGDPIKAVLSKTVSETKTNDLELAGCRVLELDSKGLPTADLDLFHPTNWIQMGYEILYLWLMRMILMSSYALHEVPFKDAYIHGILRDEHGKKFSKSSGNGIDPLEIINEYGCDALRMSVLAGISPGNDARFSLEKVEGSRNLVNKLWNISRYILSSAAEGVAGKGGSKTLPDAATLADRWILHRFGETATKVGILMERYDFSLATEVLRDFTWNEFADWYLEIAKIEGDKDEILLYILERLLILWHPFMPFVTEEIYKNFDRGLIMVAKWPGADTSPAMGRIGGVSDVDLKQFSNMQEIVAAIRNVRAEYKIAPKVKIEAQLIGGEHFQDEWPIMAELGGLCCIGADKPDGREGVSVAAGGVTVWLPIAASIDVPKERARLSKELETTEKYVKSVTAKLSNTEFTANAPEKVVALEKSKLEEAEKKLQTLKEQIDSLPKA